MGLHERVLTPFQIAASFIGESASGDVCSPTIYLLIVTTGALNVWVHFFFEENTLNYFIVLFIPLSSWWLRYVAFSLLKFFFYVLLHGKKSF